MNKSYNILYLAFSAIKDIWRNRGAFLIAVLVLGFCFSALGSFLLVLINIDRNAQELSPSGEMAVYLESSATESNAKEAMKEIEKKDGVSSVRLVNKDDALKDVQKIYGEEYADIFGLISGDDNPLSHTLYVTLKSGAYDEKVASEIEKVTYVKKTSSVSESARELLNIKRIILTIFVFFFVFMVILGMGIIFYSMYAAFSKKKDEVEIMRYTGASKGFILTPFLIEGACIGLVSGIISCFAQSIIYSAVTKSIIKNYDYISVIPSSETNIFVIVFTILVSIGFGMLGSYLAIYRRLKA